VKRDASSPPRARPMRPARATSGRAGGARARGFTLIEVIVAFALLAMALTLLLGTLTNAAAQVRWTQVAGRASLHAQSLLDQVGVGEALAPGRDQGDFEDGRYRWTLEVAPWRDPAQAASAQPFDPAAPQLLELQLMVAWGEGGPRERLQLRSLRLVRPPATQALSIP